MCIATSTVEKTRTGCPTVTCTSGATIRVAAPAVAVAVAAGVAAGVGVTVVVGMACRMVTMTVATTTLRLVATMSASASPSDDGIVHTALATTIVTTGVPEDTPMGVAAVEVAVEEELVYGFVARRWRLLPVKQTGTCSVVQLVLRVTGMATAT